MTVHTDRPMTPPSTPLWNESTAAYPSPTSSSSKSNTSPNLSQTRPSLKPSFSTKSTSIRENVQVMVRCRPRSEKELKIDEEPCWLIRPEEGSIELARLKSPNSISTFHYDNVVMGVDNEQVYKAGILDLVRSAMMGYNGTVFAYGQTASGKTYTMMGTEKEPGVIPRAVREVFSFIEEDTHGREYLLRVSYMEIYNEKIKDLLNSENTSPEIIEDKKGVYVRNLKEVIVKTAEEVLNCIKDGEGNRHISATDYNERSSRSHTIFQIVIESRSKGLVTNANRGVRVSQLNLIDLAGSEKVATDTERRKEGAYINKSLLTLGNVISKLTSDEPSTHIPFRNSKLTRILQAALSGNARISVICTINPTFASKDESLNTLRFAQRAKLVKTAAKMTRILDNSELQNCLIKIAELQTKVQEKNDLEAETRERLKNLLGLILTSSKKEGDDTEYVDTFSQFSNISADDLMKESTMRDVVARCEEGFAAQISIHEKQMDKMAQHVESLQDMMNIMESVQTKQNETLTKRDAQIEKLKQELNAIKATQLQSTVMNSTSTSTARATKTPIRATKTPMRQTLPTITSPVPAHVPIPQAHAPTKTTIIPTPTIAVTTTTTATDHPIPSSQSSTPTPSATNSSSTVTPTPTTSTSLAVQQEEKQTATLDDVSESITLAVQHITEAISTGLQQSSLEEDYDMLSSCVETAPISDISNAVATIFQSVLASTFTKDAKQQEQIDAPKSAIATALQNAIQSNLLSSSVLSSSSVMTDTPPQFTPIHEAVLFITFPEETKGIFTCEISILDENSDDVPELIGNIENVDDVPELTVHIEDDIKELDTIEEEDSVEEEEEEEEEGDDSMDMLEKDMKEHFADENNVLPIEENNILEESTTITRSPTPITLDPHYEPYSKSINQPTPFIFLFNRWTIVAVTTYLMVQYI